MATRDEPVDRDDAAGDGTLKRKEYEKTLRKLQAELCKLLALSLPEGAARQGEPPQAVDEERLRRPGCPEGAEVRAGAVLGRPASR